MDYSWDTRCDVTSLLYSIYNFDFVVAIVIVQMCLTFKKGISRPLQERSFDMGRTLKSVTLAKNSLEDCSAVFSEEYYNL